MYTNVQTKLICLFKLSYFKILKGPKVYVYPWITFRIELTLEKKRLERGEVKRHKIEIVRLQRSLNMTSQEREESNHRIAENARIEIRFNCNDLWGQFVILRLTYNVGSIDPYFSQRLLKLSHKNVKSMLEIFILKKCLVAHRKCQSKNNSLPEEFRYGKIKL